MASFLEELPRVIKKHSYKGKKQFLEVFDQAYNNRKNGAADASEWLLFENRPRNLLPRFPVHRLRHRQILDLI